MEFRSVVTPPMTYGLISTSRLASGGSSPTSVAAADTRTIPAVPRPPPADIGMRVRYAHSFLRRMDRRNCTPQSWAPPPR